MKLLLRTTLFILLFIIFQQCDFFFPEEVDPNLLLDGPVDGLTNVQKATFAEGDEAFGQNFSASTGLGPVFNHIACIACHAGDGKGHPFSNLTRFGKGNSDNSEEFDYMIEYGGPQLQNRAIPGYESEVLPGDATGVSERSALIVVGVGFLEAVSDDTLLALADPDDDDGDGISGRVNYVNPPDFFVPKSHHISDPYGKYIGRFGRKAKAIDLLHQTSGAYIDDMGITTDFFTEDLYNPLEGQFTGDNVPDPEVGSDVVANVVFYLRTLKPPKPRNQDDPDVMAGDSLFNVIGCAGCHLPTLTTGFSSVSVLSETEFHPYTDLLLHDMGEELADYYPEGGATGTEWRTTPLWGLGLIQDNLGGIPYYLHDGRTSDLTEVIRLHQGEALQSSDNFDNLSGNEKEQVLKFLESL